MTPWSAFAPWVKPLVPGCPDPMVERAAGKVAERVLRESGGRLEEAVGLAYRVVVGRPAERAELERSLRYVGGDAGKMAGLVWMLFNLDEFVFVR